MNFNFLLFTLLLNFESSLNFVLRDYCPVKPILFVAKSNHLHALHKLIPKKPFFLCTLDSFDIVNLPSWESARNNTILISMIESRDIEPFKELKNKGLKNLGIYHTGDEFYVQKRYEEFYSLADFVFRRHYDRDRITGDHVMFVINGWSMRNITKGFRKTDIRNVVQCSDSLCEFCFKDQTNKEFLPASKRQYALNLIVSLCGGSATRDRFSIFGINNSNDAKVLFCNSSLIPEHWKHSEMLTKINDLGHKIYVDGSGRLDHWKFLNILGDSAFTLSPCGHNAETYRTWETLQSHGIPIIEHCDVHERQLRHTPRDYLLDLNATVPGGFITVHNWDEVPDIVDRLMKNPEKLDQEQERMQKWWRGYIEETKIGMKRRIMKNWHYSSELNKEIIKHSNHCYILDYLLDGYYYK